MEEERLVAVEEGERKTTFTSSGNAQVLGKALTKRDQKLDDEYSKFIVDDDVSTTASSSLSRSSSLSDFGDVRRRCSLKRLCRLFGYIENPDLDKVVS